MEKIRKYFERQVRMTEEGWQFFSSRPVNQDFSGEALILKTGQTENLLSFIETGPFFVDRTATAPRKDTAKVYCFHPADFEQDPPAYLLTKVHRMCKL